METKIDLPLKRVQLADDRKKVPQLELEKELSKLRRTTGSDMQLAVMSNESSKSPSPSNSVIKAMKERRMKSIAEESVTETITSLAMENSRLREELLQLEERYEQERGVFERRLTEREHEGSKSVRILEE